MGEEVMRGVGGVWSVSFLVAIARLAGCSYTLRRDWAFKASETWSLAVFDYPLVPRDPPFSFSSFDMIEVDLQQQSLGAHRYVVGGIATPRQLRPDISLDNGSLHELERTAQQTFFLPYRIAPDDYAIVG